MIRKKEQVRLLYSNNLFDTGYLKDDLKGRSIRGGTITIFSQGLKFVLKLGSTIVLARLLAPSDFGLIAMVTALTAFAMMFKDLGLSMATIQKEDINHAQISTLFWINVVVGIVIAGVVAALSPVVAWFYDQPELKAITMSLAVVFIFGGLTVQHQALLQRHMKYFRLGLVEISASFFSVVSAIIASIYGAGYWSLIIMHIVSGIAMMIGIWIAIPWLPGLPRKGVGVRVMLSFGSSLTGFNLLNYFARNADNVLIGKFLGPSALGFYNKAYTLMLLPIQQLIRPFSAVTLPSLSRLQSETRRYRRYYQRMIVLLCLLIMPISAFVTIMGSEIVRVVLGPQWDLTGQIFRFFGLVMLVDPLVNSLGSLYVSQGRGRDMFKWGVISTVLTVGAIVLGLHWGALGVAVCYALMALLIRAPLAIWYVGRKGPVNAKDIFTAGLRPLIFSVIMMLILYVLKPFWDNQIDEIQLAFALVVSLVMVLFFLCAFPSGREIFNEVKDLSRHIFKRNKDYVYEKPL